VVQAVIVNTAMHHLFAGLPVRQLPMRRMCRGQRSAIFPASQVGLELAPEVSSIIAQYRWICRRRPCGCDSGDPSQEAGQPVIIAIDIGTTPK
jgi:hypothetical protein